MVASASHIDECHFSSVLISHLARARAAASYLAGMIYSHLMTLGVAPNTEIALSFGSQRAVVSPWGASLRRYFVVDDLQQETDIVWGYSGAKNKKGGQGDVLIPFPGRIADGRYAFDGEVF